MIPVLIVDDEVLALEYLTNLIEWEHFGFQLVGSAASVERAMKLYTQLKPQLVISDIRMPHKDGLYLCEWLRKQDRYVTILLLSAYKDFDYAKKAFTYGVSNYILKHELNPESLTAQLNKIKNDIQDGLRSDRFVREKFLNALIFGAAGDSLPADDFPLCRHYTLLMVRKDEPFMLDIRSLKLSPMGERLRETLENYWKNVAQGLEYVADTAIDDQYHLILLAEKKIVSAQNRQDCIRAIGRRIQSSCIEKNESVSILYAPALPLNRIAESFRGLSHVIRYGVFFGRGFLGAKDELPIRDRVSGVLFGNEIECLQRAIANGEDTTAILAQLFDKVAQPVWNLIALRQLCDAALQIAAKEQPEAREELYRRLQNCWTIEEIRQTVFSAIQSLATRKGKTLVFSNMIQRCLSYIHEHYQENITLDTLGALMGVHGSYLGQLFKTEVGTTFLKYLTALRIEKAKKLLLSGEYHVSEVTELVGYKTSQHFSKVFFKNVGVTPHQFKTKGR